MEKDLLLDLMEEINEEEIEGSIVGGRIESSVLEPVETTIRHGCCFYCEIKPILN